MQTKGKYFFTSESVTEGHPDKVADQISDAVLDTLLAQDPNAHVACETLVTTGMAVIAGEITTTGYADLPHVVRETIREIGYTSSDMGFDADTCAVISSIDHQSPDIAQGVLRAAPEDQGAGDQGMMFGFACNETPTLMPAPIFWAHQLSQQLTKVRKDGTVPFFRPDGKTQVSFEYLDGKPVRINNVVVSTQHAASASQADIIDAVKKHVIRPVLEPSGYFDEKDCEIFINTTGVGEIFASPVPSGHAARPGDAVLVSGALGDHGLTVMGSREGLSFLTDVASDSAPLNHMIADIITACGEVHVLRDPTRGGLATTLNEIAEQSSVCIDIEESLLPVHESVRNGCSFLGLDPLYLANEGKCICILPQDRAEAALRAMQASPYGKEATIIGRVAEDGKPGQVRLRTRIGGQRLLGMLEGAQLPRIC